MDAPAALRVKALTSGARMPMRATPGAACFDLHVDGSRWFPDAREAGVVVSKGAPVVFGTGLAFEIPVGHVMLIFSRSGHGFTSDVRLSNCVGVIDADYRGEVKVKLAADGGDSLRVMPGDRIAQAMLVRLPAFELVEVLSLSPTERGAAGFGSTGSQPLKETQA